MLISKRIAGFNDGQADSITRKITAKKKVKMFPMMKRCHIYGKKNCEGPKGWENDDNAPWYDPDAHYGAEIKGAIANGYTADEVNNYFNKTEKFSSYAFNQSHSISYAFITLLTAYLKAHYPTQFMAAVLSMQTDDKKKAHYMKVCENIGIKITVPDINKSKVNFTSIDDNTIAYGLASIKGVKEVGEIINNAPYDNVRDAVKRIPTKYFNKRIAEALIKSGAFDFENTNRKELLNEYISIKNESKTKSQQEDLLENTTFDRTDCMQMEMEVLGRSITFKPAWQGAMPGEHLEGNCTFKGIRHHTAKSSGKKMAMLTVVNESLEMPSLVFPREYAKFMRILKDYPATVKKGEQFSIYYVSGCMSKDGDKFIVNKIEPQKLDDSQHSNNTNTAQNNNNIMPMFDPASIFGNIPDIQ